jgi:antitoxin PrlF
MAVAFKGKRTTSGSSGALRIESAFFRAHPEAEGEFRMVALAPGKFLVDFDTADDAEDDDPTMRAFLSFLDAQIAKRPEDVQKLEHDLIAEIEDLVGPE